MVNIFKILEPVVNGVVKLAGLTPKLVEIEPGTVLNIWVPTQTLKNTTQVAHKPVVVFLHGFVSTGILTWLFQAISLSGTYFIYVPDFIFFGDSTTDKLDRASTFQAECVGKGLQKLGVEKCTIVGLSYGGMVGFKLARNYPDLVESMVVSSTVMEFTEPTAASMEKFGVDSWSELLMPNSVNGVKEMMTVGTHKLPWLPNIFYTHFLEAMFDNRKEKNELLKALVVGDKDAADVPNCTQRIHLLWGDDDKIFNSDVAQRIKEKLGEKASLEYIDKAGHLVPLERPFVYTQQLKKVLASFQTQVKQN